MPIQTLYATSHLTGAFTNPDNALGNTPTTWAGDLNVNSNYTSRWALGDPTDPLTSGATQTIRVLARKGSNSGTPTIALDLYQNGSLVQSLLAATDITSTTGQTLTATFPSSAISDRTGVEVEVVQTSAGGSPSARNSAQIAYLAWDADATPPSSFSRTGSDTAGATDVVAKVLALGRVVAESISLADAATRAPAAKGRTTSEGLPLTDSLVRTGTFVRASSQVVTGTDAPGGVLKRVRSISEVASVSEGVSRASWLGRGLAEIAAALDSVTRSGTFTTYRETSDSAPILNGGDSWVTPRQALLKRFNPRRGQ